MPLTAQVEATNTVTSVCPAMQDAVVREEAPLKLLPHEVIRNVKAPSLENIL